MTSWQKKQEKEFVLKENIVENEKKDKANTARFTPTFPRHSVSKRVLKTLIQARNLKIRGYKPVFVKFAHEQQLVGWSLRALSIAVVYCRLYVD